MRRIKFDEETVTAIKDFVSEGHTKRETCNKFTIKLDTLNRVMREYNIQPYFSNKATASSKISDETISIICNLFVNTDTPLNTICKEARIKYYQLQEILHKHFSQYDIDQRKAKLYRASKQGTDNPMSGRYKENHPNYKGIVVDGNGYLMQLKPEWYTGRAKSKYVFVHSVVMCEHLQITEIPKGFVVHHIDGNPCNNDIDNLALMTISAHSKLHQMINSVCKAQRLS